MSSPLPANASFKIDGTQATGFEYQDTRTNRVPGKLTSARVEYFPGGRQPFVIKGRARQGVLVASGTLRAASFAALYTLIGVHESFVDSTATCAVNIHGTDYDPVAPIGFETTGRPRAFRDPATDTTGAQIPARFIFQIL